MEQYNGSPPLQSLSLRPRTSAGAAQDPAQQAELAQTLEMFKSLNESPAPEARPPKKAKGAASAASRDPSPAPSRLRPTDKVRSAPVA